jgi:hypothetical protein
MRISLRSESWQGFFKWGVLSLLKCSIFRPVFHLELIILKQIDEIKILIKVI